MLTYLKFVPEKISSPKSNCCNFNQSKMPQKKQNRTEKTKTRKTEMGITVEKLKTKWKVVSRAQENTASETDLKKTEKEWRRSNFEKRRKFKREPEKREIYHDPFPTQNNCQKCEFQKKIPAKSREIDETFWNKSNTKRSKNEACNPQNAPALREESPVFWAFCVPFDLFLKA